MGNTCDCLKRTKSSDDDSLPYVQSRSADDRQRRNPKKRDRLPQNRPKASTDVNDNNKTYDDRQYQALEHSSGSVTVVVPDINSNNNKTIDGHYLMFENSAGDAPSLIVRAESEMSEAHPLSDEETMRTPSKTFLSVLSAMPCAEQYLSAVESTYFDSVDEDSLDMQSIDLQFKECSDANEPVPGGIADAQMDDCVVVLPRILVADVDQQVVSESDEPPILTVSESNGPPILTVSESDPSPILPDSLQTHVTMTEFKTPMPLHLIKRRAVHQEQVIISHKAVENLIPTPTRSDASQDEQMSCDDRPIKSLPTPLRNMDLVSPTCNVEKLCDRDARPLSDTPTRTYFDKKRPAKR